jgi:hypothetical protein
LIFATGDMRATPPCARMSDRTRSSATAVAPAPRELRLLGGGDIMMTPPEHFIKTDLHLPRTCLGNMTKLPKRRLAIYISDSRFLLRTLTQPV